MDVINFLEDIWITLRVGRFVFRNEFLILGELLKECAAREIKEETNLDVDSIEFVMCTNDLFEVEKRHYCTIFLRARCLNDEQEPELLEPNKCEGWEWIAIDRLNSLQPLFTPLSNFLRLHSPQIILANSR